MELSVDTVNKIADVDKYIKSWGFEPEKYSDIKEENLSITYLNSKIEVLVKEILDNQSMPMEYQTAYFKMIFLKDRAGGILQKDAQRKKA